ncbi:DMT family transporter [Brevibacillus dissolubilis]|uniref:DMT family transporter n=1 Tax=Brevibacillus dissolubilis TaxID=1844116 RepID=UPI0034CE2EDD
MKKAFMADLILLLVVFIWGATFVVVQNAIATLPPNSFNAVRFAIAAAFLVGVWWLFYRKNSEARFTLPLVGAGAFLGLWLFGGYAFQTVGLMYTTSSKAGFITGLAVVLVPLTAFFILKDKISWPVLVGVGAAVGGLYLLTLGDSLALNLGDILVFGCALCFALQIVLTGKYAPRFASLPLVIVQISTVAVLSSLYSFFFEEWQLAFDIGVLTSPNVAWALFICSIPATSLAFLAQTTFQKNTSPSHVALIFALEPVFAALTGYLWANEILTIRQILGCVLIFSGMIFAELPVAAWFKALRKTQVSPEDKLT